MLESLTASLQEVAAALGRKPDWLRRNWRKLEASGFPSPLPGSGWRWPRRAVELWIASSGRAPSVAPVNDNAAGADLVALHRAELAARYQQEA